MGVAGAAAGALDPGPPRPASDAIFIDAARVQDWVASSLRLEGAVGARGSPTRLHSVSTKERRAGTDTVAAAVTRGGTTQENLGSADRTS